MGATPEELKARIERTREELTSDIDTIADRTSPKAIARRRTQAVRGRVGGARERIMGSASSASDTASGAPGAIADKATGNPMAAGLIAFGVGLAVAALLPTTEAEEQVVAEHDVVGTLKAEAQDQAQQAKEALQPIAQEHAQQVKETATDAAQQTADHAKSAGADVADEAKGRADEVRS
jgi:hypothetical protein